MPRVSTEYIFDSENPRRTSDESILLSLKLTMSHDDHFHYGCFGRPSRRSPNVAGNNNPNANNTTRRGFFSSGGRTVLPPLHLPFRTSRSPAPDPSYSTNQYGQQDPTQPRSDYNIAGYGQQGWQPNTLSHPSQAAQFPSDPRYSTQTPNYPSTTNRNSPIPTMPYDPRTATMASSHQGQFYPQAGNAAPSMIPGPHIRSPSSAGYSTQYGPYSTTQAQQAAYYTTTSDSRGIPTGMSGIPYDTQPGASIPRRTSLSVDRTVPSRMSTHGLPPYARAPPTMSSSYDQESLMEPAIKKKRKRADAEQLKVLNETYSRTAFPSTEERIDLAKRLGMSPRSVQIWFQNKRQAMRQNSKQASSAAPPVTSEPFTAGPAPSSALPPSSASGAYPAPGGQMGSISMAGQMHTGQRADPYGRSALSPSPSSHYRGRSYDDHERRPPSRSR